jgi:hypothetical protein
MAESKIKKLTESAAKDLHAKLGIGDEVAEKLNRLFEGDKPSLGGTIDQDVCFDISKGYGSGKLDKTTFWVTIDGIFTITSPDEGLWHIRAKDGDNIIFEANAVRKGDPIHFHYKTGFKLNLAVEAWWSEGRDTKLCLHIHATY